MAWLSGSHARLGHIPALDGLRGLALLGVLFFHAKKALPGGYLGVDLFFVLSGFLITSLLLAEHRETGRISLAAFWGRRARRLFPALLILMPAIAAYGRLVAKPDELAGLRADALATLGYVANWRAILAHKSYWELFASPSPLEHTWSLSIEEQFYVVWPLVVALVLRRGSPRALLALTLALMFASMGAMATLFDPERASRAYLGTDARAAGILAGAALALLLAPGGMAGRTSSRAGRVLDVLGVVAACGLGVAWCALDGQDPFAYRGGFWLTELAALVLIACAVMLPGGLVARALSLPPLRAIGTLSYGLYLWHWPVDVVLTAERVRVSGPRLVALQFAVTFVIAAASYVAIERPIRRHGVPFGRPLVVVPAALAMVVLLVVRATYARPAPPPPPPVAMQSPAPAAPEPITFQILLLGDSTANSLGWGLRGVREPGVAVELRGQDGCTMLWDTCGGPQWTRYVAEVHPHATLVFLGGAFLHGLTADGRWREACYPKWDRKFEVTLAARLEELRSASVASGRVFALTAPDPLGPYDSAEYVTKTRCINASIRRAAAAATVEVVDVGERLCPGGECRRELDGVVIRPDGVHYCIEGAADVSRWVLRQIGGTGSR